MPKIKEVEIRVSGKSMNRYFKVVLMYNSDESFYAAIPSEFNELFDSMKEDELNKFGARRLYKNKNMTSFSRIVSHTIEFGCIENMKQILSVFMDQTIVKRNVIILFYNPQQNTRYGGLIHNTEHPQIGLQMGLTYCVETLSGDKKSYNIYSKNALGNDTRTEISLWNKSCVVIDDTLENRIFLETLYEALDKLNNKLADFTSTPEKLLNLISSGQKLLI
jgi:hypothetical protein